MGVDGKNQGGSQGDKNGGDQNIMSGTISGGIFVQGRGSKVTVHQNSGMNAEELNLLFDKLYKQVEARPPDPDWNKEDILEAVQKVHQEAAKGEQANEKKLTTFMNNLNNIAPDIVDVILASLGGPVSGITAVLKKIAERAHQQSKS